MNEQNYDMGKIDIAWCPGCGNFPILNILKDTLTELDIAPRELVMVSGIGQAAKIPHYFRCNVFNGLHGRALSPAFAIKVSNPSLTVIAESGDGDMYGEGGNHFTHTIRRNPNITNIVHNNMVYGLTKGQASPTSQKGFVTPVQVKGVVAEPFNPLASAVALDAPFVARAFCGDKDQTKEVLKQAINFNGYALVDIFQPCVTFNKVNTYKWFKENTYNIADDHDPTDRNAAFELACQTGQNGKFPLGVIYVNNDRIPFIEDSWNSEKKLALWQNKPDLKKLEKLVNSF